MDNLPNLDAKPKSQVTLAATPWDDLHGQSSETIGTETGLGDGSHLDDMIAPDFGGIDDDPDAVQFKSQRSEMGGDAEFDAPEQLDRATFYGVFKVAFSVPQMVAGPDFAPVAVQPDEEPAARDASDGLYTLLEAYYPAALNPMSDKAAALLALGLFGIGKAKTVQMCLADRQRREAKERREAMAANDNQAPVDDLAGLGGVAA